MEDDFNLVTYDMVSNPSTSNAYMHLKESRDYKIVMAQNRILGLTGILDEILGL